MALVVACLVAAVPELLETLEEDALLELGVRHMSQEAVGPADNIHPLVSF